MQQFADLKGKTLIEIIGGVGDEKMVFVTADGIRASLYYDHD